MKLVSFRHNGRASFGIVDDGKIKDCGAKCPEWASLRDVIASGKLGVLRGIAADAPAYALDEVEWLPVITNPDKIFCIGGNYMDHLAEAVSVHSSGAPAKPIVFVRFGYSQIGAGAVIKRPPESHELDYEGELAVIIGKPARRVSRETAFGHVAGYSIYNDGTLRDYQLHTTQFTPGKNFPDTGAFGPWIVTTDEIPDPAKLHLTTRLNGKVVQDSPIANMIMDVPAIIEFLSIWCPLEPGDVIITGTPAGVGKFRSPPLWMKAGDSVEVEISGIGVLRNTVADE